jgi:hypothetical protein
MANRESLENRSVAARAGRRGRLPRGTIRDGRRTPRRSGYRWGAIEHGPDHEQQKTSSAGIGGIVNFDLLQIMAVVVFGCALHVTS